MGHSVWTVAPSLQKWPGAHAASLPTVSSAQYLPSLCVHCVLEAASALHAALKMPRPEAGVAVVAKAAHQLMEERPFSGIRSPFPV